MPAGEPGCAPDKTLLCPVNTTFMILAVLLIAFGLS